MHAAVECCVHQCSLIKSYRPHWKTGTSHSYLPPSHFRNMSHVNILQSIKLTPRCSWWGIPFVSKGEQPYFPEAASETSRISSSVVGDVLKPLNKIFQVINDAMSIGDNDQFPPCPSLGHRLPPSATVDHPMVDWCCHHDHLVYRPG